MDMIRGKHSCRFAVTDIRFYAMTTLSNGLVSPLSCRSWYDTGMKLAIEQNISMLITAPYAFSAGIVGQSVTYPFVDPRSGEFVGMSIFDFYSNTILGALESKSTPLSEGGFPILIAVQENPEENTVLGPGYKIGDDATEISRVVLRKDYACSSAVCEARIRDFSDIISSMRVGDSGTTNFTRESENGGEELIHVAYAPVKVKGIRSIDSSDFARGVEVIEYGIYSFGLCEADDELLQPFKKIENDIETAIAWAVGCIAAGIFFGALFVFYVSYRVTMSITEPMLNLLELMRCINRYVLTTKPRSRDDSCCHSNLSRFLPKSRH
jgi:hypothetical protein